MYSTENSAWHTLNLFTALAQQQVSWESLLVVNWDILNGARYCTIQGGRRQRAAGFTTLFGDIYERHSM